jgi:hypothetical protein
VKEAFEGEIDVYGDGLDEYVPVNSNVDVGTRRSLVAAAAAISGVAAMGAAGGSSGGSSSSPSGSNSGGGSSASRQRGSESVSGGVDITDELLTGSQSGQTDVARRISKNMASTSMGVGSMASKKSTQSFGRKFVKTLSGLSFTLSGSVIVMFTLSGQTQRIAIIATSCALIGHLIHVFLDDKQTEVE